jgi:hypothetical protein
MSKTASDVLRLPARARALSLSFTLYLTFVQFSSQNSEVILRVRVDSRTRVNFSECGSFFFQFFFHIDGT